MCVSVCECVCACSVTSYHIILSRIMHRTCESKHSITSTKREVHIHSVSTNVPDNIFDYFRRSGGDAAEASDGFYTSIDSGLGDANGIYSICKLDDSFLTSYTIFLFLCFIPSIS